MEQSARLTLRKGAKTLTEARVELSPGVNRVAIPWVSAASGLQEYTVDLNVPNSETAKISLYLHLAKDAEAPEAWFDDLS